MWNEYARIKMLELEAERAASAEARNQGRRADAAALPARPVRPLAPVVRATGRGVRRLGEALESWAAPAPAMGNPRH